MLCPLMPAEYVVFQCVFEQLISVHTAQRLKQRLVRPVTYQFICTVQSTVIPFTPVRKELSTCNQRTQDMFNSMNSLLSTLFKSQC